MAERVNLADTLEELLNFTLQSFVNGTLEFDLGLPKDFCSQLLQPEPNDDLFPPSLSDTTGKSIHPFLFYFVSVTFQQFLAKILWVYFLKVLNFQNFSYLRNRELAQCVCIHAYVCVWLTTVCTHTHTHTHTHKTCMLISKPWNPS